MNTYVYPNNAEIRSIAQAFLPQMEVSKFVLELFPLELVNENTVIWEQYSNYIGNMHARGLNGSPQRLKRIGASRQTVTPGVYGSFVEIDEEELTVRRDVGTFNQPMDISDLVLQATVQVTNAEVVCREALVWTLLTTGTYTAKDDTGAVLDSKSFTQRVFTATVPWATTATATPLADLRALKLLHRGYSVAFDRGATIYANQKTINNLMLNSNSADLGGKRRDMGATFNSLADVNKVLLENDLPQFQPYDEGYYDEAGNFNIYIPDATGVVKGRRPNNEPIGEWVMTRNANNPGMAPGTYMKVIDTMDRTVPRKIEVHRGFNGCPVVYYGFAIPVMNV